eukprot:1783782-Amphidinium_carterae.1
MGVEHMKDTSHFGALGQYGHEGNSTEEGVEQIHAVDFGNKLYADVLRTEELPEFAEIADNFQTEEHKGDILESVM